MDNIKFIFEIFMAPFNGLFFLVMLAICGLSFFLPVTAITLSIIGIICSILAYIFAVNGNTNDETPGIIPGIVIILFVISLIFSSLIFLFN